MRRKRAWKCARTSVVPVHQVARAQQQIEEVERALARLQRLVAVDASEQLLVQQRRQVGVGAQLEVVERRHQPVARLEHLRTRDALGVRRPAALPCALEVAVAPQLDEQRLESVERLASLAAGGMRLQVAAQPPNRLGVDEEVVAGVRRRLREIGQRVDEVDEARDRVSRDRTARASTARGSRATPSARNRRGAAARSGRLRRHRRDGLLRLARRSERRTPSGGDARDAA